MPKSVSIRRIDTPNLTNRYTFARIDTPRFPSFSYLCRRSTFIREMNITDFYNGAPVLTTVLTLAYVAVMGVFAYMLIRMYRK